jgi:hypothetical protein
MLASVTAGCGMPDTPLGTAASALHARLTRLDRRAVSNALRSMELVALWGPRRVNHLVPAGDVLTFGIGALPDREDALRAALGEAADAVAAAGMSAARAVVVVAAAIADSLRQGAMTKEEVSAALHGRIPIALEPWCGACRAAHVPEPLLRLAATAAGALLDGPNLTRLELRAPNLAELSDDQLTGARLELTRRYLRSFGPTTPEQFAAWAGTGTEDAVRRWQALGHELVEMQLGGRVWMLRESLALLRDPPLARGVRLLPPGDPFLDQRDRATLLPDFGDRRRLWRPGGAPGLVLFDGEPVAVWRSRSSPYRLRVRLEPFGDLGPNLREEIGVEVQHLAEFLGAGEGVLTSA